jgi:hypothetical protein
LIKLWKGIEKEGIEKSDEIVTLFICSDIKISFELLLTILQRNTDIKSLYFGAGRREFAGMQTRDWDNVLLYCIKNDIKIIIEVSPSMLDTFAHLYNYSNVTFIVSYYNAPKNMNNLYFKTDDFITTKIYTSQKEVDITMVQNDRYPDDLVLYEEE